MKGSRTIGERMKQNYEHRYKFKLPMRFPVIIRIDGKSFHTWTKKNKFTKPFDQNLIYYLNRTCGYTCEMIQGVQFAYLQSDEISFLIHNYKSIDQQAWFDNNIQKIVSVSASIFSSYFNYLLHVDGISNLAFFDSRVFILPEEEVCNYFIWRQQDWLRNSLQMYARQFYSHNELKNKCSAEIHEMLYEKGVNWANLSSELKNGRCIVKEEENWVVDNEIPVFTQNRDYIEKYLEKEE